MREERVNDVWKCRDLSGDDCPRCHNRYCGSDPKLSATHGLYSSPLSGLKSRYKFAFRPYFMRLKCYKPSKHHNPHYATRKFCIYSFGVEVSSFFNAGSCCASGFEAVAASPRCQRALAIILMCSLRCSFVFEPTPLVTRLRPPLRPISARYLVTAAGSGFVMMVKMIL